MEDQEPVLGCSFLNAAHGGDFSWSNRPDRERALKAAAAPPNPADPVLEPQALELPLTNVHCVLIGQLDVFTKFWAQLDWPGSKVSVFLCSEAVRSQESMEPFFGRRGLARFRAGFHDCPAPVGALRPDPARLL